MEGTGEWMPHEKLKVAKKIVIFPYLELFLVKFSILACISLKIGYFEFGHDCDLILGMLVLILVCMESGDP